MLNRTTVTIHEIASECLVNNIRINFLRCPRKRCRSSSSLLALTLYPHKCLSIVKFAALAIRKSYVGLEAHRQSRNRNLIGGRSSLSYIMQFAIRVNTRSSQPETLSRWSSSSLIQYCSYLARMLKPIPIPENISLSSLPAITLGAGTFSGQYNENHAVDVAGLVSEAYRLGIRSFDTSPYYGDSEKLLGGGLRQLFASGIKRDDIFIMTKCGRYGVWEFDYSPETIIKSVRRSCARLGVEYLDVVFLHDVEFVAAEQVLGAVEALYNLKEQGIVRNVGISGYPLQVLDYLIAEISEIGKPLDVALSYSHYNIQNTTLIPLIPDFKATGVKAILSASPLSMGLLRESGPPEWHPASEPLKQKIASAVKALQSEREFTIANIAVGFALKNAPIDGLGSTVIGFCSITELHEAVELYWEVTAAESADKQAQRNRAERQVVKIIGSSINETWASPPEIGRLVDPRARQFLDESDVDL